MRWKCVLELALRDAFHDSTMNRRVAAEDDTREWQLVGTMSPRLINTQPATPRPVTTTRYAFRDDREPSLPKPPSSSAEGGGGERRGITRGEDSSRFEKMDDPSILRVLHVTCFHFRG